jgi:hypothetical protein
MRLGDGLDGDEPHVPPPDRLVSFSTSLWSGEAMGGGSKFPPLRQKQKDPIEVTWPEMLGPTSRFSISNDGSERRIAPKALDKFKTQIREMTRRTRGISLPRLIEDLTPYLIGWRGYFGSCQTPRVLTNLEAWIRRRLRSHLWRQWQNGHNRFTELRRRGVPKFNAAVAAGSPTGFWRMSGHPAVQQALPDHHFDRSPPTPRLCPSLTQSNRRGT